MNNDYDNHFRLVSKDGIACDIPVKYLNQETVIGENRISYQLLRLKATGLFSNDELFAFAKKINEITPGHGIDWKETFLLLYQPFIEDNYSPFRIIQWLHGPSDYEWMVSRKLERFALA